MTITEFHRVALDALKAEPDEIVLIELAKQAQELSDMVSWADGVIDKNGVVTDAFMYLQAQAKSQHEATNDKNVAILHDVIGELMAAIYRHDEDFDPSSYDNDENVEL